MNRDLLYKLTIGGMFLIGGVLILYSVVALFTHGPGGIDVQNTELQLNQEHTPLPTNGNTVHHKEKKDEISFDSTSQPTDGDAPIADLDEEQEAVIPPSTSEMSNAEIEEIIVKIRELEKADEEYTQQLKEIQERKQEILELCRIHDRSPERTIALVDKLTTDKTLSKAEKSAMVEQLRQFQIEDNLQGKELEEMWKKAGDEGSAISSQRRAVRKELKSLRRLVPEEVSDEK